MFLSPPLVVGRHSRGEPGHARSGQGRVCQSRNPRALLSVLEGIAVEGRRILEGR